MNTDPDFYPLASTWLEGTATPAEQRVLSEILHRPEMMEEYAALCHTEALLRQSGRKTPARHSALGALLQGKPWKARVASAWQSPAFRWPAAAAAIALITWAVWPGSSQEQEQASKKRPVQPVASAPDGPGKSSRESALLPPADGLERDLRRYYVAGFKANGPLPEAAAKITAAVKLESFPSLSAETRSPGDAPVQLHLFSSLPAWTVLELMALQTGTEVRVSGSSIVFLPAAHPVPVEGSLTKTANRTALRQFMGLPAPDLADSFSDKTDEPDDWDEEEEEDEPQNPAAAKPARAPSANLPREKPEDEPHIMAGFVREILAVSLSFTLPDAAGVKYSGSPRGVRLLELALRSPARPLHEVTFSLRAVSAPEGRFSQAVAEVLELKEPGPDIFRRVLNDTQFQLVMRKVSMMKGVDLMTFPSTTGPANEELEMAELKGGGPHPGTGFRGHFCGLVSPDGKIIVSYGIISSLWVEAAGEIMNTEDAGSVTMDPGTALIIPADFNEKGKEGAYLLTPTFTRNDGFPVEKPPAADPPAADPSPPAADELPYGIPVPGKKGMVQSPYAPDKGQIDVDGYKRGTRVECPYSGKHFRVP